MKTFACSIPSLSRLTLPLLLLTSSSAAFAQSAGPLVEPEKTVTLAVSNRDINRVVCPTAVQDVFFSQEKPADVSVDGRNVYVKFKIRREGERDGYVSVPLDLNVVCGDQVYTMILQPQDMDATAVRLGVPKMAGVQATLKDWGALPDEERCVKLTLAVYQDELPSGFTRTRMASDERRYTRMYKNLALRAVQRVSAPGLGLAAIEYEVIGLGPVTLDERDFLDTNISNDIVAVTVDPLVLSGPSGPGPNKARLIVIERGMSDGR